MLLSESCTNKTGTDTRLLTPPPAAQVWEQQLHPHLQRNQQLQDVLLQREEELQQLQEENWKLREFLASSFVKNLEVQAQVTADSRNVTRELKRNEVCPAEGPFQNRLRPPHQQISKRVCRDPTELCYQPSPEAALDLWVLQMLGQKDSDSMDPSPGSSSAPASSPQTLVHASPSSSSDFCLASHSKSVSTRGQSPQHRSGPSSRSSDLIVSGSSRLSEASDAIIMSSCPPPAFQSPPEEAGFRWPSARPGGGFSTWSPAEAACCLSALHRNQDGPQAGRGPLSPSSSSSPVTNQQWSCGGSLGRPSGRCWLPADTPAAVVFSTSLSPSCSVRTHSFPQGQAFVRRNPEGRWNFTWVPRQGP